VDAIPEEVYAAEAPVGTDPVLAPREHDSFTWCSVEQALELLRWEENRSALVAARDFVAGVSRAGERRSRS
jgi:hypothetical protein